MSAQYLSRKTGIERPIVEDILSVLAHKKLLDAKFYFICNNEDPDLVHYFEFDILTELKEFIGRNGSTCPNCNSELLTSKTRVAFVKKGKL